MCPRVLPCPADSFSSRTPDVRRTCFIGPSCFVLILDLSLKIDNTLKKFPSRCIASNEFEVSLGIGQLENQLVLDQLEPVVH